MEVPAELTQRIDTWEELSRWERAEVGRDLRRLGLSYREIMALIDVKKSTLATWCRDVKLTAAQKAAILERTGSRAGIPVDTNWRRRLEIQAICQAAEKRAITLMADPLWVSGVVLYWAEGAKTRNHLALANSDPDALRLFIGWLRRFVDTDARFVLQMHLHEGNDETLAKVFWRESTGLMDARFYKTFIKPAGTGHRKNTLAHGVCGVRVLRAADHWSTVMTWVDIVASAMPTRMAEQ